MYLPMPPSAIWVVKLGGALHRAAELPAWLAACAGADDCARRCVVVTGGGALADEVRALQARWHFDDQLAHALALDTMRMNARLLQGLAPDLMPCSALHADQLPPRGPCGGWLWSPPRSFAPRQLPASWSVTSDSIALWLAQALGAQAVLLVKSVVVECLPSARAVSLAAEGVVDAFFPQLLAQGEVSVRLLGKTAVDDFKRHLEAGTLPGIAVD